MSNLKVGNTRCSNKKHSEWCKLPDGHDELKFVKFSKLTKAERNIFIGLGNKNQYRNTQSVCTICRGKLIGLDSTAQSAASTSTGTHDDSRSQCQSHASDVHVDAGSPEHVEELLKCKIDFERLVNDVKSLKPNELASLMREVGRSLQGTINQDIEVLKSSYKDLDFLNNINIENWLQHRSEVLVGFLEGLAGAGSDRYALAKAVESAYHARNQKNILPLAFSENVVAYSVTNSKLASNMHGVGGGGGYESVRQWLNNRAAEELPPVKGDVVVAFDNDQVVGKSYHSRADNKLKMSIITAVSTAEINKNGVLQEREDLMPRNWHDFELSTLPDQVSDERSDFYKRCDEVRFQNCHKISDGLYNVQGSSFKFLRVPVYMMQYDPLALSI